MNANIEIQVAHDLRTGKHVTPHNIEALLAETTWRT
jgi:hypothetical protein